MLLLLIYAATGPRVAGVGRENSFFTGLLLGCEILVGANVDMLRIDAMGNPNSLRAMMYNFAALPPRSVLALQWHPDAMPSLVRGSAPTQ